MKEQSSVKVTYSSEIKQQLAMENRVTKDKENAPPDTFAMSPKEKDLALARHKLQ